MSTTRNAESTGKHIAKMSFRPPGFQFGMIITLLTLGFAVWQFVATPAMKDSKSDPS